jgi:hypothetical protein
MGLYFLLVMCEAIRCGSVLISSMRMGMEVWKQFITELGSIFPTRDFSHSLIIIISPEFLYEISYYYNMNYFLTSLLTKIVTTQRAKRPHRRSPDEFLIVVSTPLDMRHGPPPPTQRSAEMVRNLLHPISSLVASTTRGR